MMGVGLVVMLAGLAPGAMACQTCTTDLYCNQGGHGAMLCMGDGNVCGLAGRCTGFLSMADVASLQVTLLDASPGTVSAVPSRVVRNAGEITVGREAGRLAGGAMGDPVFSLTGVHEGGVAAFVAPAGDGFALRRENAGRGAWITVYALDNGRIGRVLGHERIDAEDAMVIRVPFDGRTRTLVLQAANLPTIEAARRDDRVRRELRESHSLTRALPARAPFELRLFEDR
jgi:hypothetical protein